MSNDKIDVLAVLDVACKLHKEGAYADAWEVDLARIYDVRAAVAELIAADEEYDAAKRGLFQPSEYSREKADRLCAANTRRDAALARVRSS